MYAVKFVVVTAWIASYESRLISIAEAWRLCRQRIAHITTMKKKKLLTFRFPTCIVRLLVLRFRVRAAHYFSPIQ